MNKLLTVVALAACLAAPAFADKKEKEKAKDAPAAAAPAEPAAPAAPAPPAAIAAPATPPDPNMPLAKVGDSVVTAEEFSRFARFRLRRASMEAGKKVEADGKFRLAAMSELIASRMLEQLAKEAKLTVSDDEVNADYANSRKMFKTPEEYEQYLKAQDLSEAQLKEEVRRKLLINKFVESKTKDLSVTPEEVQAEYDTLKAKGKFNRDSKTVDLAQIVALYTPDDAESEKAAKAKIEAVRARIEKGEKFEDVGKEVSADTTSGMQLGLLDEAKPVSLFPDIAKAIEPMKPGEVSAVIKTSRGYGIVTVKGWFEPGVVPLEKVKAKIEAQIKAGKQQKLLTDVITEAKGRIPVEMYKTQPGEAGAPPAAGAAPAAPADKPAGAAPADAPAGLLPPSALSQTQ